MQNQASIIVIDDEQIIRDGCTRILSKEGWEVATAENGQQGLDALQKREFDLMLLDLIMPGIGGFEVLEKTAEISPDTIVVVITGYATVESAVEAMKKGAYDFIPKPFTPDQLRITVRRGLERKSLAEEAMRLKIERANDLRAITTERSRLRTIIHCMADGVIIADSNGQVVLSNSAAIRLLEIEKNNLAGSMLKDYKEAQVLAEITSEFLDNVFPPSGAITREFQVGKSFLRASSAPVQGTEGNILGSITVLQNITYLKELDQMKTDFVAMVSHELKSPIVTVRQQLMSIMSGLAGKITEKQKKIIDRSEERLQELSTLIENLLDISRIEAGFIIQRKEPLNIVPLIKSVLATYESQVKQNSLQVFLEVPDKLPMINADHTNMEEVMANLISNAINYTPDGGKILVRSYEKKGHLVIEVEDTGIGIAPEDQKRIFDKFYRVKSDRNRNISGTGLGLPIVKGIIEAHLGTIELVSKLGKGSLFRILLPLACKD